MSRIPAEELRKKAEEIISQKETRLDPALFSDIRAVIEELNIHQIELELQNEELGKTQLELEQSRNQYLELFEHAPNAYLSIDTHNRILKANTKAFELLSSETLIKQKITDFIKPEYQDAFYLHKQKVLKANETENIEIELKNPANKKKLFVRLQSRLMKQEKTLCIHVALLDISVKKIQEKQLKKNLNQALIREKEVKALLQASRSILQCHSFEETAKKIFDACKEITGAQSGYVALLNSDMQENEVLFLDAGGLPCDVNPELPMPVRGLRAEAYHKNKAVFHNDFMRSEWVELMPHGHVELRNVLFAPLVIEGKTVGIIGLANKNGDFNEHDAKMAEAFGEMAAIALRNSWFDEALKESEERYKTLFEEGSLPSLIINPDTLNIQFANKKACGFYGYEQEQILKLNISDLIKDDDIENKFQDQMNKIRAAGKSECHVLHRTAKGVLDDVEMHCTCINIDKKSYIFTVIIDNSEKKKTEAKLQEAQKMDSIGNLAGGFAHEVNNMLGVVTGYTSILQVETNNEEHLEYLKSIMKASHRAADLTRKLLAYARRGKYSVEAVNLNNICSDILSLLKHSIPANIEKELLTDPELHSIDADPYQISQMIMNICINAVEAMNKGGKLSIITENISLKNTDMDISEDYKPGSYVKISIKDSGTGMHKELIKHIYEPFFSTKKDSNIKAYGLGLSTAYGIIKNHNGFIELESEPGEGSVFHIYLPKGLKTPESRDVFPIKKITDAKKILLIESEPIVRKSLSRIIKKIGHHVIEAESTYEGLNKYSRDFKNTDAVIINADLPENSNMELLRNLQNIHSEVRVILCIGSIHESVIETITNLGVRAFLPKPFTVNDIKKALDTIFT
jgi:two-component system, cell cycle sensor histidine kinase and response regulator CckA